MSVSAAWWSKRLVSLSIDSFQAELQLQYDQGVQAHERREQDAARVYFSWTDHRGRSILVQMLHVHEQHDRAYGVGVSCFLRPLQLPKVLEEALAGLGGASKRAFETLMYRARCTLRALAEDY